MVLDERSRHELYLRLEEVLGPEAATTLMEHLPPIGWADVAMKRDLDSLEQRFDLRFEALEERLDLRCETLECKLLAAFRGELQTALTAQVASWPSPSRERQGPCRPWPSPPAG